MKEYKDEAILPCYRDGYGVWHYLDDTHDKVYELNRQICDLGIPLRNPIKPISEETAQELIGKYEKIGKEWASKNKEIVESIFGNITNEKSNIMEKKTMTKDEAFEWLSNKKIDASINEREVQLKLFSLGVVWCTLDSNPTLGVYYLLIDKECHMTHCGSDWDYYKTHHYEEISADDILSIEIVDAKYELEFNYDKVVELAKPLMHYLNEVGCQDSIRVSQLGIVHEPMSTLIFDPTIGE